MKSRHLTILFILVISRTFCQSTSVPDTVFAITNGSAVTLWDMDARRNCASSYIMQIQETNQQINWIQRDTNTYAYCDCTFDYSVTFGPVSPGDYQVNVYYTESGDSTLLYVGSTSFSIENPVSDTLAFRSNFSSDCGGIHLGLKNILKRPVAGLSQNFPNPFNEQTVVSFYPGLEEHSSLLLFDLLGELVREIPIMGNKAQLITIPRLDAGGRRLKPGVYFYRLNPGGPSSSHRMIILD